MNSTRKTWGGLLLAGLLLLGATPDTRAGEEPITVIARYWITRARELGPTPAGLLARAPEMEELRAADNR